MAIPANIAQTTAAVFWLLILLLCAAPTSADDTVTRNTIYGMASGAALLFDVHHPEPGESKQRALVMVPGSGWYADQSYQAQGLKEMNSGWQPGDQLARTMVHTLVDAGYTVFVTNHRAAPKYRFPTANNDIAQAVAYIRANAQEYGVDPRFIGGMGTSSGGSLVSLLGVDEQYGETSRLQAIATLGSPMHLASLYNHSARAAGTLTSFMGRAINYLPPEHPDVLLYHRASTTTHIDAADAPHLLIHGSLDELVPISQSRDAGQRFAAAGVTAQVIEVPHGKHSENLLGNNKFWLPEIVRWMDKHLKTDQ